MSFYALVSCTLIHWLAIYGSRPYISLLVQGIGNNSMLTGMIAGVYGTVQVLLALQVSNGITRYGAKKLIVLGNIFLTISYCILFSTNNLLYIAFCSLLLGIAHVLVMVSAQYMVTGFSGSISREKAVGLYTFSNSLGIFIGPTVGAYLHEKFGLSAGFGGTFFIALTSLIIAFFIKENERTGKNEINVNEISVCELIKDKKVFRALVVSSMVMFTSEIVITYFPIYGQEIGLTVWQIGMILSASGFSMTLVRPFLGKLSMHFSLSQIIFVGLLTGGFAMMFYGFVTIFGFLLIVASVCGLAQGILGPATMLAVTNATKQTYRGKVLALRTMIVFGSQSLGPVLCGLLSSYIGIAPMFVLGGSIMGFCSKLAHQQGD